MAGSESIPWCSVSGPLGHFLWDSPGTCIILHTRVCVCRPHHQVGTWRGRSQPHSSTLEVSEGACTDDSQTSSPSDPLWSLDPQRPPQEVSQATEDVEVTHQPALLSSLPLPSTLSPWPSPVPVLATWTINWPSLLPASSTPSRPSPHGGFSDTLAHPASPLLTTLPWLPGVPPGPGPWAC